ncbi:hypothetical protein H5J22_05040 [Cetobacterium sp. 8H]|uniref:hypothetical protein n=1 Tax=Cetobacterium sp. 8H TaxID=2759681 RepID=UPI00163B6DEE|nr:hypothetical protein [Cetobacterium sp. 8H]MBC2850805.1 hypothetical protein [Cetobacterium sp. 8H]
MDIFINGEKVDIGIKSGKLVTVLERIESRIMKHGEVIVELRLDGENVDGRELPLNKKVKVLELKTRSHREILIESLYLLEIYTEKFHKSFEELEENPEDITKIFELVSFVEWALGIVLSIKEATKIDMIYSDFDEYVLEFKKYAQEMIEAFKKEDYTEVVEILDGAIFDLVEDLRVNCKDYLKEIIKEEGRKNLLN